MFFLLYDGINDDADGSTIKSLRFNFKLKDCGGSANIPNGKSPLSIPSLENVKC